MFSISLLSRKYIILHLTWFAFFLSFLVWFSFAPFVLEVHNDLSLTSKQLKTLAICNLALTIPARILIGMLLDRWGARITFAGVLVFAVIPCFMTGFATSFQQLVYSSLTMGVMGAGFVVGVRMVAEWFPPQEIGIAQGIYGGWGNFGAGATFSIVPLIKREITGQIAGNVGAYGNVGGVLFLTLYNFSDTQTLFNTMAIALICTSLCVFFLKEPNN